MEKVKLGDICEISAGQGAPQGAENYCACNEGTPFIKAGDLVDLIAGKSESAIQCVSPIIAQKHKLKLYPQGSILFAKSGMSCMKGYVYRTQTPCYIVSHLAIITPYKVDGNYLKYHFQYNKPNVLIKDSAYPSISLQDISNMEIALPSLEEQKAIAERLDKVSGLIEKRKTQLEKLDLLIKSRFIEMFGDPKDNPKGYAKKLLKETCKIITGNTPSRAVTEYYGDDIEWIKTDNIVEGILYPTTAAESLSKKGMAVGRTVEKDSILMACIAGSLSSIGRVCVTDRKVAFNQQINAIEPIQYNTLFLYVMLQLSKEYLIEEINMALKGILSKSKLEEKMFILPPMDLQQQFAVFVEQVDKSKFEIQKSLEKLEILKKSLMQQYLG